MSTLRTVGSIGKFVCVRAARTTDLSATSTGGGDGRQSKQGSANLAAGAYRSGAVIVLGQPPRSRAQG